MKVVLVWPFGAADGATVPLCYLYLLPILRQHGHQVTFLDCALDQVRPESDAFRIQLALLKPDVVGVSAWTVHRDNATAHLRAAKAVNPRVITIAGGPHFSGVADYSVDQDRGVIDYVLKGEAEETLPALLEQLASCIGTHGGWVVESELMKVPGLCFVKQDGTVHSSAAAFPPDLDSFGRPDYEAIRLADYLKAGYSYRSLVKAQAPLLTTRGCPYTCDFCAAPQLNGRRIRKHGLDYLRVAIDDLYDGFGIRHINIIDDNFTFDTAFAKAFCRMVLQERWKGLTFGTPNGIRIERTDPQLFALMRAAGWRRLIVAPESGSQKMVDAMSKHLKLALVPAKVHQIQRAGIEVEAFFIVGHPGETWDTVLETRTFIHDVKFDAVSLHIFQPLHGTPIHDQLMAHGLLTQETRIASYGAINWLPEGWSKAQLYTVIAELNRVAQAVWPWRVEWVFSKHTRTGEFIGRVCSDTLRHHAYVATRKVRTAVWDLAFRLRHHRRLQGDIAAQWADAAAGAEQEVAVMHASDKLVTMADLALTACTKVRSHKGELQE